MTVAVYGLEEIQGKPDGCGEEDGSDPAWGSIQRNSEHGRETLSCTT